MEYNREYRASEVDLWLGKDAAAHPSPYLDAILSLSPGDVVEITREAEARSRLEDEGPEQEVDDSRTWSGVAVEIATALKQLPQRDLVHARAVYSVLTDSPFEEVREQAAFIVPAIVPFDHDFGLQLWDRLLADRSATVRLQAFELPGQGFEIHGSDVSPEERSEEGLRRLGMTWRDAFQLTRTYAEAEQGRGQRGIGQIVLDDFLKTQDERDAGS
jgi:hypothetical protein